MKTINVCYIATENFYEMCHKSAESLIKSKNADTFVNLTIIAPQMIHPSEVMYFDDLNSDTVKVYILFITGDSYWNAIKDSDYPVEQGGLPNHDFKYGFYKIECLKLPYDRVLYLDCDTIIFRDISELFEMEMDKPLAVVPDVWQIKGCKGFNAGMILFNNKLLRNTDDYEKFISIAKRENTNDQSLFNRLFTDTDRVQYLSPIYHCSPLVMFSDTANIMKYFNGYEFDNTLKHNIDLGLMKIFTDKFVKICHIYGSLKGHYNEVYDYLVPKKQDMNLLYCVAGQRWIDSWTYVSVNSIIANNNGKIRFHIITDDDYDFSRIETLINNSNNELIIHKVSEDEFRTLKVGGAALRWDHKYATFYRFKIVDLIQEDRILYIDNDVICDGDISELYNSDIKLIGAIKDYSADNRPNDYFNAGVILFNLKEVRNKYKDFFIEAVTDSIKHPEDTLDDQDVLNRLFKDDKVLLHQKYNFFTRYGEMDLAILYHFSGLLRHPWDAGFDKYPNFKIYSKYNK